jgi:predicted kinase
MFAERKNQSVFVIIGGFAGTGKSAISRRLSAELHIPRLGSDTIGRTIKRSEGIKDGDAYWIAYDVLFALCEEFVQSGTPVVLDMTMGWAFQWLTVDAILARHPHARFLPIILRCPLATCIERVRQRYGDNPEYYDPPEVYTTEPKNRAIWAYLSQLDCSPAVHFLDADRPFEEVYAEVKSSVLALMELH